jgi:tetratricopeptide (TPR) repeat protein
MPPCPATACPASFAKTFRLCYFDSEVAYGVAMAAIKALRKLSVPSVLAAALLFPAFTRSNELPQALQGYLSRATALENAQNYPKAETVYLQALKAFPNQPEVLKRLGILYQTELKFSKSIQVFQEALQASPDYPDVNLYLGLSYYGLNDYSKALDAFHQELKAHPDNRRAHYYAAMVLESTGRNLEAIEHLEAIVKVHPDDSKVWYQLAKIYRAQAMNAFEKVADLAPNSVLVRALKAESYAEDQKYPEAIKEYNEILKQQPNFPGAHSALGQAYFNNVQYADAERELRLALQEDPYNPMANYELGDILLRNHQPSQSLPLLQVAVKGNAAYLPPRVDLGKCYLALGMLQQAREVLVKATQLDANDKEAHYVLAQVYSRLHDVQNQKRELSLFEALDKKKQEKLQGTAREMMRQPQ